VETQRAVQAKKPTRIALPNIFTPNGDGQNETLQIQWGNTAVEDFSIVVLDAKNNVVFKSDRPDFNWDGTDLGGKNCRVRTTSTLSQPCSMAKNGNNQVAYKSNTKIIV